MLSSEIIQHFDKYAETRSYWFKRNRFYHQQIIDVCKQFLNADSRVLELGCSTGDLLAALNPNYALGIDISPKSIEKAQATYPHLHWVCANVENLSEISQVEGKFDLVIVEDLMGYIGDIQVFLENIKCLMHSNTRLIVSTWNWIWEPALRFGELIGQKSPDIDKRQNWISARALKLFLELSEYEIVYQNPGLLFPVNIPIIAPLINAWSYAPLTQHLTLLNIFVCRPTFAALPAKDYSVSVIIPTRNEAGNIVDLVERTPKMGSHTELIFVDGSSTDGTVEAIHQQIDLHPELDIKFIPQVTEADVKTEAPNLMLKLGKGDAVRKGFRAASGDILMILDSDISVPPEQLERFYHVLVSGKAHFANGTRFVYSQENGAMKPVNRFGNVMFSWAFTWLLGQEVSDTLCGTKVLFKSDYDAIAANRHYFGDFDPFGDFDLLFGAALLGQKIKDIPITYLARTYGESKVRVSQHGPLLVRMAAIGLWQLKIRPFLYGKPSINSDEISSDKVSPNTTPKVTIIAMLLFAVFLLTQWLTSQRRK
jgi:glycosyltransferase involved in cell wall biosynthesis/ubiquinone/menaquinone biosynthesis C-methylase UbiE